MSEHPSGRPERQAWLRYQRYPYLLAKVVLFGILTFGVFAVLQQVQSVLFPVLASLLVAYLLDPIVDRLEERGWSRTWAIGVLLLFAFWAITGFVALIVPVLVSQVSGLAERLPEIAQRIEDDALPFLQEELGIHIPATLSEAIAEYGTSLQDQIPTVTSWLAGAFGGAMRSVGAVSSSLVNIVTIPLFTFYFLRDFDTIRDQLAGFLPTANNEFLVSRIRKVDVVFGAWFRGQVQVAVILAAMYGVGLAIVFGWSGVGIGAGIAVGVMAGLLNIIPYFGFAVGFGVSMLLVVLDASGFGAVVGVVAVFAIVQTLEGYLITPRIVGDKVGLSPVVVIIALLLGQELLGLVGMLLALPIAGAIRVLAADMVAYYKSSTFFLGEDIDDNRSFVEIAMQAENDTD